MSNLVKSSWLRWRDDVYCLQETKVSKDVEGVVKQLWSGRWMRVGILKLMVVDMRKTDKNRTHNWVVTLQCKRSSHHLQSALHTWEPTTKMNFPLSKVGMSEATLYSHNLREARDLQRCLAEPKKNSKAKNPCCHLNPALWIASDHKETFGMVLPSNRISFVAAQHSVA